MKRILFLLVFVFVFAGCGDVEERLPVTTEEVTVITAPTTTSVAEPPAFSPIAKEQFLMPIEEYSWEREFSPEYVMLHFTSAVVVSRDDPYNMETVRKIFEDGGISIHYVIDRDGGVYCYMPETRAAWHAGKGTFASDERLTNAMNKYSIGIEMLAIGSVGDMAQYLTKDEYEALDESLIGFTDAQYESLSSLVYDICERNAITFDREHVIGHEEYNSQKRDPGELFDWERLFGKSTEPEKTVCVAESLDE